MSTYPVDIKSKTLPQRELALFLRARVEYLDFTIMEVQVPELSLLKMIVLLYARLLQALELYTCSFLELVFVVKQVENAL